MVGTLFWVGIAVIIISMGGALFNMRNIVKGEVSHPEGMTHHLIAMAGMALGGAISLITGTIWVVEIVLQYLPQ